MPPRHLKRWHCMACSVRGLRLAHNAHSTPVDESIRLVNLRAVGQRLATPVKDAPHHARPRRVRAVSVKAADAYVAHGCQEPHHLE
jgi:hypothetical protein